jgi:hypothetical protein
MQKSLNFSVELVLGDRQTASRSAFVLFTRVQYPNDRRRVTDVSSAVVSELPHVLCRRDNTVWFALCFTMMHHRLGFHVYSDWRIKIRFSLRFEQKIWCQKQLRLITADVLARLWSAVKDIPSALLGRTTNSRQDLMNIPSWKCHRIELRHSSQQIFVLTV